MSHFDIGPLANYNSLTDQHLSTYFSNARMRNHLVKTGLLTKRGELIPDSTYRQKMARKEHKRTVRDLLAQAIVDKTLDMERVRQVSIRRKIEEISKLELVKRVKSTKKANKDLKKPPPTCSLSRLLAENLILEDQEEMDGDERMETDFDTPVSSSRRHWSSTEDLYHDQRHRKGDEELLPLFSQKIRRPKRTPNRLNDSGRSHRGENKMDEEDTSPEQESRRRLQESFPDEEIDTKHLQTLDSIALREYARVLERQDRRRKNRSPYQCRDTINAPSSTNSSPRKSDRSTGQGAVRRDGRGSKGRRQGEGVATAPIGLSQRDSMEKSSSEEGRDRRPRGSSRTAGTTSLETTPEPRKKVQKGKKGRAVIRRPEPAVKHQTRLQSLCEVTIKYHGQVVGMGRTDLDPCQEVSVEQQHCGGNTLTVFRERIEPGESFTFSSRRHRGFPFSLTFYVNGVMDCRLSSCCEYKHRIGGRLGGKMGHFGYVAVTGAAPCYRCQVEKGDMKVSSKPKKKEKDKEKLAQGTDPPGVDHLEENHHTLVKCLAVATTPQDYDAMNNLYTEEADDFEEEAYEDEILQEEILSDDSFSSFEEPTENKKNTKHKNRVEERGTVSPTEAPVRFPLERDDDVQLVDRDKFDTFEDVIEDFLEEPGLADSSTPGVTTEDDAAKMIDKEADHDPLNEDCYSSISEHSNTATNALSDELDCDPITAEESTDVTRPLEDENSPQSPQLYSITERTEPPESALHLGKASSNTHNTDDGADPASRMLDTAAETEEAQDDVVNKSDQGRDSSDESSSSSSSSSTTSSTSSSSSPTEEEEAAVEEEEAAAVEEEKEEEASVEEEEEPIGAAEANESEASSSQEVIPPKTTASVYTEPDQGGEYVYIVTMKGNRNSATVTLIGQDLSTDPVVITDFNKEVRLYTDDLGEITDARNSEEDIDLKIIVVDVVRDVKKTFPEERPAPSPTIPTYIVTTYTDEVWGSGTDSNVFIKLFSQNDEMTEVLQLTNPNETKFERGGVDTFKIFTRDIGPIIRLEVGMNQSETGYAHTWHCDKIIVENVSRSEQYEFPCGEWLSAAETDEPIVNTELKAKKEQPTDAYRDSSPEPSEDDPEDDADDEDVEDDESEAPSSSEEESTLDEATETGEVISDEDSDDLDKFIVGEAIVVRKTPLTTDMVSRLSEKMRHMASIDTLTLNGTDIDDGKLEILLSSLIKKETFTMLNLSTNNIGPRGALFISQRLTDCWPNLNCIVVNSNPIGDRGILNLVNGIQRHYPNNSTNSTVPIKSMDLGDIGLTDDGAESIAELLAGNYPIEGLELTGNRDITLEGWTRIGAQLGANEKLEMLSLDYCNIDTDSFMALVGPLEENKTLHTLDFEGNDIDNEGVEYLIMVLEKNTTLREITIMPGNAVSDEMQEKLREILDNRS